MTSGGGRYGAGRNASPRDPLGLTVLPTLFMCQKGGTDNDVFRCSWSAWVPHYLCCVPFRTDENRSGIMGLIGRKTKKKGDILLFQGDKVMSVISKGSKTSFVLATLAIALPGSVSAQQDTTEPARKDIVVTGQPEAPVADPNATMSLSSLPKGPEIKGIISARSASRMQVTTEDGANTIVAINEATKIKSGSLFGGGRLSEGALLNGLPVTVKTLQAGSSLIASQISLRKGDLKTAKMIRNGTAQGFAEQTAATAALRGRMGDIDEYNIKGTTNVNFATGKAVLSEQGKADLCETVTTAQGMKNAYLLVVGYTDSTGSQEFNQRLSEKRASRVVNHIQQACGWKPYRMLTPTGMAEADPLADNSTAAGKAQNRRVSVNILVSKGLDGL
jgi:OmpA-OmpF porin, OOP family